MRGIARNCARRRTVGEPGEEGRVVRTFRERRRWVARQRERQQLGDGVLDECEAEGERVADESVLIGEERAQVVAVAERQGGFVDRGDGRRDEGELDGEAEGDEGVEHQIDLEHLVRGRVRVRVRVRGRG